MRKIFISYRRSEAEYAAGALGRALREHFGVDQVFRDKEDIGGGVSWKQQIASEIGPDAALLVLIGKDWAGARDAEGRRRLDNPDDPIRMEISGGLARGASIIPVLLENAVMPEDKDLPPELKPMAEHNALRLRDSDWQYDLDRILRTLEGAGFTPTAAKAAPVAAAAAKPSAATVAQPGISAKGIIGAVVIALVIISLSTETLDHNGYVGALALSIVALALGIFAWFDTKRGAARGRILAIVVSTLSVLGLLAAIGGLTPGDAQNVPASGTAPAANGANMPSALDGASLASARPSGEPAARLNGEMAASAANQRNIANAAAATAGQSSSVAGRWRDADDGTAIVFTQDGSQVSMMATQQGIALEGHGIASGQQVRLSLSMAGMLVGELHLTLSPDGRNLHGNMLVQGDTEAVHFVR
jgi:hypothetical protein